MRLGFITGDNRLLTIAVAVVAVRLWIRQTVLWIRLATVVRGQREIAGSQSILHHHDGRIGRHFPHMLGSRPIDNVQRRHAGSSLSLGSNGHELIAVGSTRKGKGVFR